MAGWVLSVVTDEIEADAATVWNVLIDIAGSPQILSAVQDVQFTKSRRHQQSSSMRQPQESTGQRKDNDDDSSSFEDDSEKDKTNGSPVLVPPKTRLGLRWTESRDYYGHVYKLYKTITTFDETTWTIKIAVSMEDQYHSVVHTTAMTVKPSSFPSNSGTTTTATTTNRNANSNCSKDKREFCCRIVGTYALQYNWKNRMLDLLTFGPCRTRKAKRFFENELAEYAAEAQRRFQKEGATGATKLEALTEKQQ